MSDVTRYEIHVHAVDDKGDSSHFLHKAMVGPGSEIEADARNEFERVIAAMRGDDVGIFGDHYRTAELQHQGHVLRRVTRLGDTVTVEELAQ